MHAAEPVGEPGWYVISSPDSIAVNTVATNVYPCELVRVGSIARAWAEAVARVSELRSYIAELRSAAGFEIATFADFTKAMNLAIVDFPLGYDICRVANASTGRARQKEQRAGNDGARGF